MKEGKEGEGIGGVWTDIGDVVWSGGTSSQCSSSEAARPQHSSGSQINIVVVGSWETVSAGLW